MDWDEVAASADYMIKMDHTAVSDALCLADPPLNSQSEPKLLQYELDLGSGLSTVVGFVEVGPTDWSLISNEHWKLRRQGDNDEDSD